MERKPAPRPVAKMDPKAVFALTARSRAELNSASTSLTPAELRLLVLVDGKSNVAQVIERAQPLAADAVQDLLEKLVKSEHLALAGELSGAGLSIVGFTLAEESAVGVQSLQKEGYFVRIVRRAAEPRKVGKDERLTVLVVEDDPQLAKLLGLYLRMDNMQTRMASSRDEIAAALNLKPLPDLVLLDVVLPDVSGFDVLSRMRGHEAMKKIPVIMCTARTTREAVLEGMQRGADGYITKPFDVDVLHKAVKTVLGLP
ncbi:MAG TPA: response regulator [Burkholderiales bacterium]